MKNLIYLTLLFYVSCGSNQKVISPQIKNSNIIIFIPGFYGSALSTSAEDKPTWLTLSNALFNKNNLVLPDLGFNETKNYKVNGVLKEVSIIPGLLSKNVYGSFIKDLNHHLGRKYRILEFAYDWRQDISESSSLLKDFVLKLKKQGAKSVSIISHSMGGLLTNYFLRYGGQKLMTSTEDWSGHKLIDKVVIAATPFKGTVTIFKDIFTGVQFGLNTSLLSPQAYSSFPATYQLMGNFNLIYNDKPLDYFNYSLWEKNKWSLANDQFENFPSNKQVRLQRLKKLLRRGKVFNDKISATSHSPPPSEKKMLLSIKGHQNLSPGFGLWDSKKKEILWRKKDIGEEVYNKHYLDGDGLVTLESAQLPVSLRNYYTVSNIRSEYIHSEILDDEIVKEKIYSFFN